MDLKIQWVKGNCNKKMRMLGLLGPKIICQKNSRFLGVLSRTKSSVFMNIVQKAVDPFVLNIMEQIFLMDFLKSA